MQTNNANKWEHGKGAEEFGSRLRYVMSQKKISQTQFIEQTLANLDIEINKGTMSEWFNGKKKPQLKNIVLLASELECDAHWLNYGEGLPFLANLNQGVKSEPESATGPRRIPVISYVQAGGFAEVYDPFPPGFADEYLTFDEPCGPNTFALIVEGESMLPDFPPGMRVIVDPSLQSESGDLVVVKNGGDEVTFKKISFDGGRTLLFPLNRDFLPPIDLTGKKFHVIGVVIGRYESLRWSRRRL